MNSVTWDWAIFDFLNFDGGATMDAFMTMVSGVAMWIPLYILIIYMVWRRYSWRGLILFLVCVAIAMGMADVIAGIFKQAGVLKDLGTMIPARPRPMFTEALTDVHVPSYSHGKFGTISAHAATIVALAFLSSMLVRKCWFSVMMICVALIICYSRIYLACHFPQDILLGTLVGLIAGGTGVLVFKFIHIRWR